MSGLSRNCVFDDIQKCPVKKMYKLKPESLVEFCKICKKETNGMNIQKSLEIARDAIYKREERRFRAHYS